MINNIYCFDSLLLLSHKLKIIYVYTDVLRFVIFICDCSCIVITSLAHSSCHLRSLFYCPLYLKWKNEKKRLLPDIGGNTGQTLHWANATTQPALLVCAISAEWQSAGTVSVRWSVLGVGLRSYELYFVGLCHDGSMFKDFDATYLKRMRSDHVCARITLIV